MADDRAEATYRERAIADADRHVADLERKFEEYTQNVPPGKAYEYEILASVTLARLKRAREHRVALQDLFIDLRDRGPSDSRLQTMRLQEQFTAQVLETRTKASGEPSAEVESGSADATPDVAEPVEGERGAAEVDPDGPAVDREAPFVERAAWTYRIPLGRVVLTALLVIGLVIGGVVVLLNRGGSKKDGSGPTVASFAGHYEFVRGFDDSTGADVYPTAPGVYDTITPGPASGAFDIDGEGRITAGDVSIRKTAAGTNGSCSFVFEASAASGSVSLVEPGARGDVSWPGTVTFGGDCGRRSPEPTTSRFEIGIVGDTVVLCRSGLQASLDACGVPQSRVVAVFTEKK